MTGSPSFPQAVVFDLDGTLVETAPDLCAALNHVLSREGRPTLTVEQMRDMVGDGARRLIERGLAASGPSPTAAEVEQRMPLFLDYYGAHIAVTSRPFPGVVETLSVLARHGVRMGVCTNKPVEMSRRLLRALSLDRWFGTVLGGDSLEVRKPHPRHLMGVIEGLGATPAQTVMVGDSRNDVASARGLGVPVIVVSYGYTTEPAASLGADRLIDGFEELLEALPAVRRRDEALP